MNLVTNAAQAIGDRPGRIEIALEPATVDSERATAELRSGDYARITVADDGCGMDRDIVERIFDPFFTTKPAGEGTGLGLSVVAGIMKSHGGAVNVYSEKSKGSVFRLYFPATADLEQTLPAKKVMATTARGQRVLYIDDDEFLVSLVKRKLTRLGYMVTCEQDPKAALALFLHNPQLFDVVVTDLSMPGLRGFDLAREMLAVRPDLPVIVASGYVRPEDQAAAREIGVRELVLKPNTSDDLGALLDQLFKDS
jgi:CheY-like chemotaxis protein